MAGIRVAGSAEVEVGRGVLDIRGILTALLAVKYAGHVGFEDDPIPENPLPESLNRWVPEGGAV